MGLPCASTSLPVPGATSPRAATLTKPGRFDVSAIRPPKLDSSRRPAQKPCRKDVHYVAFERKRKEPEVARCRHLKDPPPLVYRESVVPLRRSPVIPELPQPAAYPAGGEKSVEPRATPLLEVGEQRRQAQAAIDRDEQKGAEDNERALHGR